MINLGEILFQNTSLSINILRKYYNILLISYLNVFLNDTLCEGESHCDYFLVYQPTLNSHL